jgi:hypothetical protein
MNNAIQPSRKQSTVRKRAIGFIISLSSLGYTKTIPLNKAKELFSRITDLWDRTTLKAYFGTQEHKSTRKISRMARYGTGTYSFKNIELSQEVCTTKGYLEKMGLVEMERKGNIWFMNICSDSVLVPQLFRNVVVVPSNISLSRPMDDLGVEGGEKTGVFEPNSTLETNNNLQSEREKYDNASICNYSSSVYVDDSWPIVAPDNNEAIVVRQSDSKESLKGEVEG